MRQQKCYEAQCQIKPSWVPLTDLIIEFLEENLCCCCWTRLKNKWLRRPNFLFIFTDVDVEIEKKRKKNIRGNSFQTLYAQPDRISMKYAVFFSIINRTTIRTHFPKSKHLIKLIEFLHRNPWFDHMKPWNVYKCIIQIVVLRDIYFHSEKSTKIFLNQFFYQNVSQFHLINLIALNPPNVLKCIQVYIIRKSMTTPFRFAENEKNPTEAHDYYIALNNSLSSRT